MISCTIIFLRCVSISSLASVGTLHLPCCSVRRFRSSGSECLLFILPILSKETRNLLFKSLMILMADGLQIGAYLFYGLVEGTAAVWQ